MFRVEEGFHFLLGIMYLCIVFSSLWREYNPSSQMKSVWETLSFDAVKARWYQCLVVHVEEESITFSITRLSPGQQSYGTCPQLIYPNIIIKRVCAACGAFFLFGNIKTSSYPGWIKVSTCGNYPHIVSHLYQISHLACVWPDLLENMQ